MTVRCVKCHRKLTRPPVNGMGPVCAKAMFGAKPARIAREARRSADERQAELFISTGENHGNAEQSH